jgi:hypothetical protein
VNGIWKLGSVGGIFKESGVRIFRLISWQYFTVALDHVPCPRWMREIEREGNGRWLWMEMTLILMWKIVGISLRLFLNGDVDICLLFCYLYSAGGGDA